MKRSFGRRVTALVGGMVAAVAVVAFSAPAVAQVPEGTQAIPLVGAPFANCPPGSAPQLVPVSGTINGVTVNGAGRCTPLSADSEGTFTVGGATGQFTSECHNAGGTIQGRSGVTVPTGTIVNGVAVTAPTVIETQNQVVIFPGGRRATLNTVTSTADSVTFRAIVFDGGPIVGQTTCGLAAYPLAVGSPSASGAIPALPELPVSTGGGGGVNTALLAAGALAVVLAAQVLVSRRMRRSATD